MPRTTLDVKSIVYGWIVVLAIWAACSYILEIPEYLIASPVRVGLYMVRNAPRLFQMVWLTGTQAIVGWAFGVVFGAVLGSLIFYLPRGRRLLMPPLLALQTTPIIALAPLVTFWFGYGWWSKVVVAAIVSLLPIVLAMYSGLGDAKPAHIHLFKVAGASERVILSRVRLQSAWTSVVAALKVAIIFAVIGSIVAEFMGGSTGLGFLIMKAVYGSKGDLLISAVLGSALLGQVLLLSLEHSLARWEYRFAEKPT